jgi:hypothetical protein
MRLVWLAALLLTGCVVDFEARCESDDDCPVDRPCDPTHKVCRVQAVDGGTGGAGGDGAGGAGGTAGAIDAAPVADGAPAADAASTRPDAEPDAGVLPLDAAVRPPDAEVQPPDAEVQPPDAEVQPPDAEVQPPDAEVLPLDAEVLPLDAEVLPLDAEVLPLDAAPLEACTPGIFHGLGAPSVGEGWDTLPLVGVVDPPTLSTDHGRLRVEAAAGQAVSWLRPIEGGGAGSFVEARLRIPQTAAAPGSAVLDLLAARDTPLSFSFSSGQVGLELVAGAGYSEQHLLALDIDVFHTYRIEWDPASGLARFFIDGELTWTIRSDQLEGWPGALGGVLPADGYPYVAMGAPNPFVGAIMDIDYVRWGCDPAVCGTGGEDDPLCGRSAEAECPADPPVPDALNLYQGPRVLIGGQGRNPAYQVAAGPGHAGYALGDETGSFVMGVFQPGLPTVRTAPINVFVRVFDIAWHPALERYGVAWSQGNSIWMRQFDPEAMAFNDLVVRNDGFGTTGIALRPTSEGWLMLTTNSDDARDDITLYALDAEGRQISELPLGTAPVPTAPALAEAAPDQWLAVWYEAGRGGQQEPLMGRRVDLGGRGALDPEPIQLASTGLNDLEVTGRADGWDVTWRESLVAPGARHLALALDGAPPEVPAVISTRAGSLDGFSRARFGDGWMSAWTDGDELYLRQYDADFQPVDDIATLVLAGGGFLVKPRLGWAGGAFSLFYGHRPPDDPDDDVQVRVRYGPFLGCPPE